MLLLNEQANCLHSNDFLTNITA